MARDLADVEVDAAAAEPGSPGEFRWPAATVERARKIALIGWAVAFVLFCATRGLPLDRLTQTLWLLAALFAVQAGRPWSSQRRILRDWLPFVGFLLVYDYTRGIADKLGMPIHVTGPAHVEHWLFHGTYPTVWLQQHLFVAGQVRWYDIVVSIVYFSHFFAAWIVAGVLYVRNRERWGKYARRILALSYAGLLTYMLFPAAPPWFASSQGVIPPVQYHVVTRGWDALGLPIAGALIAKGQAAANLVAAIPSLHAAFALLLTLFFWRQLGWIGRTLMVLYTAAMAFALVYGAEHYVLDVLIGYFYVAVVLVVVHLWERRRERRAAPEAVPAVLDIRDQPDDALR